MRSSCRRGLLQLFVCLFLNHGAAFAEPSPVEIIDLLPAGADRPSAASSLSGHLGQPVKLEAPDPLLIEALKWATPTTARQVCMAERTALAAFLASHEHAIDPSADPLPPLLTLARDQLLYLQAEQALETLEQARRWLPCLDRVISRAQLTSLLMYEAVAHVYGRDGQDEAAFLRLLAVDPGFAMPSDYGPKVSAPFERARQKSATRKGVMLELEGLEVPVFLDGEVMTGSRPVLPGLHLAQVASSWGEVRGTALRIDPGAGGAAGVVRLADLNDFGLPRALRCLDDLARRLSEGKLEPAQLSGCERYQRVRGGEALRFALAAPVGTVVAVLRPEGVVSTTVVPAGAVLRPEGVVATTVVPAGAVLRPEGVVATTGVPAGAAAEVDRAGDRSVPAKTRSLRLQVDFGAIAMRTRGDDDVFQLGGAGAGLALALRAEIGRNLFVGLHGSYVPLLFRPLLDTGVCAANADQLARDSLIACQPVEALIGAGVEGGYRLELSQRLAFIPALSVEAIHYPQLVVQDSDGTDLQLMSATLIGPMARVRLSYGVPVGAMRLGVTGEVYTGVLPATLHEVPVLALPAGAGLSTGLAF